MYRFLGSLLFTIPLFAGGNPYEHALHQKDRLETDLARDKTSKPAEILAFCDVKAGMQVLDVLAGGGYYTELLAHVVGPRGKVVSHNNQAYVPFVKEELDKRYTEGRLTNVERILKETDNMELGSERFDLVFFVLGYHDLYYKDKGWEIDAKGFMKQLRDSLKPGGTLLVIDHAAAPGSGSKDAQTLHRIDPEFVKSDVVKQGFTFVKSSDVLANGDDDHTILVFDKSIRRKTDRFVYLFKKSD